MIDAKSIFLEEADISSSPTSNVIQFNAVTDVKRVPHSLVRLQRNSDGISYINSIITTDVVGTETVKLQDSADGVTYADVVGATVTFAVNASVGDHLSFQVPLTTRNYIRVNASAVTSGNITVYLGRLIADD